MQKYGGERLFGVCEYFLDSYMVWIECGWVEVNVRGGVEGKQVERLGY